jgi:hypothetical protein
MGYQILSKVLLFFWVISMDKESFRMQRLSPLKVEFES